VRNIKMLGLAVVAVAAFTSFIGVSSAAAAPHELIGLCGAEELVLCKSPLTAPQTITGTQEGNGVFVGGIFGTEECTGGTSTGKVEKVDTNPLVIKNLTFVFTGCTPCTKVTVETIAEAKVSMNTVLGNDWVLTGKGGAKFEGCPLGAKCKFGGSEVKTLIEMGGGKAWVNTNGTALKLEEGSAFLCGSEGKWTAKFNLTAGGKAVFPTLLGEV